MRPSDQTTPPITAASRSSSFSAGGSRSTRAVTMPSTLSGSAATSPAGARACGRTPPRRAGCRRPLDDGRAELLVRGVATEQRLDEPRGLAGRRAGPSETVSALRLPSAPVRAVARGARAVRSRRRAAARPRPGRRARRRSRAGRRPPTGGRRSRARAAAARRATRGRCRQPAKSSVRRSRSADVLGRRGRRAARGSTRPSAAPPRGARSSTARASFAAVVGRVVVLVDPGLRLDDLAERPERDARRRTGGSGRSAR